MYPRMAAICSRIASVMPMSPCLNRVLTRFIMASISILVQTSTLIRATWVPDSSAVTRNFGRRLLQPTLSRTEAMVCSAMSRVYALSTSLAFRIFSSVTRTAARFFLVDLCFGIRVSRR